MGHRRNKQGEMCEVVKYTWTCSGCSCEIMQRDRLTKERDEFERKGKDLCSAYGNALMLLHEYRNNHFPTGHKCRLYRDGEDLRCDLCKRTDQQLQPKGEQG